MKQLKEKIEKELKEVNELYSWYLEKLDAEPSRKYLIERVNEIRIEIRTYEKVLEMIKGVDKE